MERIIKGKGIYRPKPLLCTVNCRFPIVKSVGRKCGFEEAAEDDEWDIYWTDRPFSRTRSKEMSSFQKVNHFFGMVAITRKDLLAQNLNKLSQMFPEEYDFYPDTWCLPSEFDNMIKYSRKPINKNETYICKPENDSQGRGIHITTHIKEIKPTEKMICQKYISKPLRYDGFKFDLRVYVLITCCNPLSILVYNEGLVRLASVRYEPPTIRNTRNIYMHLTNYSVNKHYPAQGKEHKMSFSRLNAWFEKKCMNVSQIWKDIHDVVVKTVIAAHPAVKENYDMYFTNRDGYACFEILGFDILLDYKLKPYLLEVNRSPSLSTDKLVDRQVKEQLLIDTFRILNLDSTMKNKNMQEDRREECRSDMKSSYSGQENRKSSDIQREWEDKNLGNFKRIYPANDSPKYDWFMHCYERSFNTASASTKDTTSSTKDTASASAKVGEVLVQRQHEGKIKEACDKDLLYPEVQPKKKSTVPDKITVEPKTGPEKELCSNLNLLTLDHRKETERRVKALQDKLSSCQGKMKYVSKSLHKIDES